LLSSELLDFFEIVSVFTVMLAEVDTEIPAFMGFYHAHDDIVIEILVLTQPALIAFSGDIEIPVTVLLEGVSLPL
jgi:hypothetical protein